jgi:hypothetical protein
MGKLKPTKANKQLFSQPLHIGIPQEAAPVDF